MSHENLFTSFARHITLTPSEQKKIAEAFKLKKLKKRQLIISEGDVCRFEIFVSRGMLRAYTIDGKGDEHVAMFAMEGWWTSDLYSFLTETPATQNIEALEDAELFVIEKTELEKLYEEVPKLERFFRILLQNAFVANQQRIMATISQTAEERYLNFINKYPTIEQRAPQHQIASYLGMTAETISRIRRQRMEQNKK